jgi:hypothetical protein
VKTAAAFFHAIINSDSLKFGAAEKNDRSACEQGDVVVEA